MIYLLIPFLLAVGYYTCSYGVFIMKKEKNILAAVGTIALGIIGVIVPIIVFLIKY